MVAGSFASTFHGLPRTTQDIDLVIDPDVGSLDLLLKQLPEDLYYVDCDTAREALRDRTQFNIIDMATGWKMDCIIRKNRAFSISELERKESVELLGVQINISSPEDTIISKLEWAKLGGSERQLRDVQGIVDVRGAQLDLNYIERWVDELELGHQWGQIDREGIR